MDVLKAACFNRNIHRREDLRKRACRRRRFERVQVPVLECARVKLDRKPRGSVGVRASRWDCDLGGPRVLAVQRDAEGSDPHSARLRDLDSDLVVVFRLARAHVERACGASNSRWSDRSGVRVGLRRGHRANLASALERIRRKLGHFGASERGNHRVDVAPAMKRVCGVVAGPNGAANAGIRGRSEP